MFHDGINLLFAKTKSHCLLQDGAPKLIGEAFHAKRYLVDNTIELQEVVNFHYGNKNIRDTFIFENNRLVYHSCSLYTESFLTDLYGVIIQKEVSPEALISIITETWVIRMMGF